MFSGEEKDLKLRLETGGVCTLNESECRKLSDIWRDYDEQEDESDLLRQERDEFRDDLKGRIVDSLCMFNKIRKLTRSGIITSIIDEVVAELKDEKIRIESIINTND